MSFLIDTNVVSEWARPQPAPSVVAWFADADEDRIFLSVVTLAELRRGVARLVESRRRNRLDEWLRHELPLRFEGRIAATAQVHRLTLVTRNTGDFEGSVPEIVNPWM